MIKNLFKQTTPEEQFWNWFVKHSNAFYEMSDDNHLPDLFRELDKQLSKINGNLTFEFSLEIHHGIREFIISADGIVDTFP